MDIWFDCLYWKNKMVENKINFQIFIEFVYCLNLCELLAASKIIKFVLYNIGDVAKCFANFHKFS